MTTYNIFQIIVFAYTGLLLLIGLTALMFQIIYMRGHPNGTYRFLQLFNKINGGSGMRFFLPFWVFTALFSITWIALALPWLEVPFGTSFFMRNEHGSLATWFGTFSGTTADLYFLTVSVTGIGLTGCFFPKHIRRLLDATGIRRIYRPNWREKGTVMTIHGQRKKL